MSATSSPIIPPVEGVTTDSVHAYVAEQWPDAPPARCLEISGRHALVEMQVASASIRPGGFISGPTQFGVADLALWYAVFGAVGLEAMALTSELAVRFLRPATGRTLRGRAELHSVGSRTVVGTVVIWTDDEERPVSVCQGSYALPRTPSTVS